MANGAIFDPLKHAEGGFQHHLVCQNAGLMTKKFLVNLFFYSGSGCCTKVLVGSTGQARVDQALYMGIYARSIQYEIYG